MPWGTPPPPLAGARWLFPKSPLFTNRLLERPGRAAQMNMTLARPRQEPLPLAATRGSHDLQAVTEWGCLSDGRFCSKAQGRASSSSCRQGCHSDLTGTTWFFSLAWGSCKGLEGTLLRARHPHTPLRISLTWVDGRVRAGPALLRRAITMSLAWPPHSCKRGAVGHGPEGEGGRFDSVLPPGATQHGWVTRESSVSLLVSPSALPDPEAQCVCRPLPGKADS